MDDILKYYDYIRRLAMSRSDESDDIVSETFLAAYAFLSRGGGDRASEDMALEYLLSQTERFPETEIPHAGDSQSR